MNAAIPLLDHGLVRLVDHMGSDLAVVRSARVSYDAAWRAGEDEGSDHRLIRYLWRHGHTSPFESCTMTFEVKAPIFVMRQWHRHRTQSYNELSARYRELPEEFYVPRPEDIGVQASKNKQGRETNVAPEVMEERRLQLLALQDHCARAFETYRGFLAAGWPRELARTVLPTNTYSHMFTTVNLLNVFRFFTLRCDGHAQYEIRVYADAMVELLKPHFPVSMAAWEEMFKEKQA
jgi:thymidylate synthase (FAD)